MARYIPDRPFNPELYRRVTRLNSVDNKTLC